MKLKDVPIDAKFMLLKRNKTFTKKSNFETLSDSTSRGCKIQNSSGRTDIADGEMEVRFLEE